jgi:hypothetical protein
MRSCQFLVYFLGEMLGSFVFFFFAMNGVSFAGCQESIKPRLFSRGGSILIMVCK